MAKFSFRLQALLNLKEQLEESLKNDLGKAQYRLDMEKQLLLELESFRDNYSAQISAKAEKGVGIKELREYSSYILYIRSEILKQKDNVNSAVKNVDKYREMLIRAVQEKEMLERLREKKLELHRKEELRLEQGIVDEIVSYEYSLAAGDL